MLQRMRWWLTFWRIRIWSYIEAQIILLRYRQVVADEAQGYLDEQRRQKQ